MLPTAWEIATLVCKLLVYGATALSAGVLLHLRYYDDGSRRLLDRQLLYLLAATLLGFHAALIQFLVQVGQINARGLAGMFDWSMASFLLDTPNGASTVWRLAGFVAGLALAAFFLWKIRSLTRPPDRRLRHVLQGLLLLSLALLLWSYRAAGHVSVLPALAQLGLVLHVFAFAAWIGALPLFLAGLGERSAADIKQQMEAFGNQAMALVIVLAVAGVLMLFYLLQTPQALLNTAYGRALLLKFLLVLAIMGIAALNRFRLVPALARAEGVVALRRSLRWEVGVAVLILTLTAWLSTLVGPAEYAS